MGRPKGSKNKAEEIKVASLPKREVTVTVKPRKVEEIIEPVKDSGCSCCLHESSMHYGSADKWCNVTNCQCQQLV